MISSKFQVDKPYGGLPPIKRFEHVSNLEPCRISAVLARSDDELLAPLAPDFREKKHKEIAKKTITKELSFQISVCKDIGGCLKVKHIVVTNYFGYIVFDVSVKTELPIEDWFTLETGLDINCYKSYGKNMSMTLGTALLCFKDLIRNKKLICFGDHTLTLQLLGLSIDEISQLDITDVSQCQKYVKDGLPSCATLIDVLHRYLNFDPMLYLKPRYISKYSMFLYRVFYPKPICKHVWKKLNRKIMFFSFPVPGYIQFFLFSVLYCIILFCIPSLHKH